MAVIPGHFFLRQEEHNTDDPIEGPSLEIRTRVKSPYKMKESHDYHPIPSPPVHIPNVPPSLDDKNDVLHRSIGSLDGRCVVHHQEQAGHNKNQKEKSEYETKAKCVCGF